MSNSVTKAQKPGVKKTDETLPLQKPHAAGKTAKELINKHILNKDDVITDEDFKNLNIDINATDNEEERLIISNKTKRPKDEDKDPEKVTPWDVISE